MTYEEIVKTFTISVFRAAYSVCRQIQDAEDITQETFLAFCLKPPDTEDPEYIKAWLLRTAMNKASSLTRSFWRKYRTSLEEAPEPSFIPDENSSALLEAVFSLPVRCRKVVHLHYLEGYSIKEIAAVLNISEGTVKTQLYRGRALLKQKLKEEWYDEP